MEISMDASILRPINQLPRYGPSDFQPQQSSYSGSKLLQFDINKIENKLKNTFDIKAPSTSSFTQQQFFRSKNQQSSMVKAILSEPPTVHHTKSSRPQETKATPPVQLFQNSASVLQVPGQNQKQSSHLVPPSQSSMRGESSRSQVFDFRKSLLRSNQNHEPRETESKQMAAYLGARYSFNKPLTPIKETKASSVVPPSSRRITDPDNNILFLDNGSRIINPVNVKTPPPPMWGEILEEENYDPNEEFYNDEKAQEQMNMRKGLLGKISNSRGQSKKLKKKVIYVYESDSDDDQNQQREKPVPEGNPYISIKEGSRPLPSIAKSRDANSHQALKQHSMRGHSIDVYREIGKEIVLPSLSGFKGIVPQSKNQSSQIGSSSVMTRPIRSGAFQRIQSFSGPLGKK